MTKKHGQNHCYNVRHELFVHTNNTAIGSIKSSDTSLHYITPFLSLKSRERESSVCRIVASWRLPDPGATSKSSTFRVLCWPNLFFWLHVFVYVYRLWLHISVHRLCLGSILFQPPRWIVTLVTPQSVPVDYFGFGSGSQLDAVDQIVNWLYDCVGSFPIPWQLWWGDTPFFFFGLYNHTGSPAL